MIKTVIAINGQAEPYSAEKLCQWIKSSTTGFDENEWFDIAADIAKDAPETITVQKLMQRLIDKLVSRHTWTAYSLAGKLLAILTRIEIFGSKTIPKVREVQTRLHKLRLMRPLKYTGREWDLVERAIEHDLDLQVPHYALEQLRFKYSLQDFSTKEEFETSQFIYMRLAMTIFENHVETGNEIRITDPNTEHEPYEERSRIEHVLRCYRHFANKRLSAPTPNYNNFGTYHFGLASCCLTATGDDRFSLAVGDHVNYMMTTQSAGQGLTAMCRSIKDAVQGGRFLHRGKKPYIDTFGKNVLANVQGGRGGAGNFFTSIYDPEARMILGLRDPRASDTYRNRDVHYSFLANRYFHKKFAKEEDVFVWNCYTAPDLHEAFYSKDLSEFIRLYEKYEADPNFKKTYISARDLMIHALTQGISAGGIYGASIDEINRNTPFIDMILSSNLCMEVTLPTWPYTGEEAMKDLYSDHEVGHSHFIATKPDGVEVVFNSLASKVYRQADGTKWSAGFVKLGRMLLDDGEELTVTKLVSVKPEPEVALCSLGATNVTEEISNEMYKDVMYYGYRMIDYSIDNNKYIMPHIGVTAKARRNAGMGIMGVATHMARRRLLYNTHEGLQELHKLAERHLYYAIEAALQISKERGNAPWIDRTYWPEGWNPTKTYRKEIDSIGTFISYFDFDEQSERVKANGGIAFSSLINFMPGESSSKALGAANCYYQVREKVLVKTDAGIELRWAVPYGDDENYLYQSAYDLDLFEQNKVHAMWTKFNDQAASADKWIKLKPGELKVPTKYLLNAELDRVKYGNKTFYYTNVLLPVGVKSPMELTESVGLGLASQIAQDLADNGIVFQTEDSGKLECEGCGT